MKCFTCFAYLSFEDEVEVEEDDNVEVSSLCFAPELVDGVVKEEEVMDSFLPFLNNKSKIIRNVPSLNI